MPRMKRQIAKVSTAKCVCLHFLTDSLDKEAQLAAALVISNAIGRHVAESRPTALVVIDTAAITVVPLALVDVTRIAQQVALVIALACALRAVAVAFAVIIAPAFGWVHDFARLSTGWLWAPRPSKAVVECVASATALTLVTCLTDTTSWLDDGALFHSWMAIGADALGVPMACVIVTT